MKQLNIFGEVDHLDNNGKIKRCEICNKSIAKGDCCSEECAKKSIENAFNKM